MAKKEKKATKESSSVSKSVSISSNGFLIGDSTDSGLKFRIEESYKSIRTNIMLSVVKKGCKKFVISSSNESEGKTTTSINIAISLAQAEQKVLLVDCDLRKPKIHHYFSVSNTPGLTNYLTGTVSNSNFGNNLSNIIHPSEIKNLSVITSGQIPPNPAEILSSSAMTEFLEEIEKYYDYVIIDTPPINVVSDALPIIRQTDGIIIVVKENYSAHPELKKTIEALNFIDAKITGFIVNYVDADRSKYGYGKYKYGRYGKYGRYYGRYSRGYYSYRSNYGYGYGYEYS